MTNIISKKQEKEILVLLENEFGNSKPTKKQVEKFVIERNTPKNDGGISIAIATAAFLLQLYSEARAARQRKLELQKSSSPPPPRKCPRKGCGLPAATKLNSGQFICKNGHKWK